MKLILFILLLYTTLSYSSNNDSTKVKRNYWEFGYSLFLSPKIHGNNVKNLTQFLDYRISLIHNFALTKSLYLSTGLEYSKTHFRFGLLYQYLDSGVIKNGNEYIRGNHSSLGMPLYLKKTLYEKYFINLGIFNQYNAPDITSGSNYLNLSLPANTFGTFTTFFLTDIGITKVYCEKMKVSLSIRYIYALTRYNFWFDYITSNGYNDKIAKGNLILNLGIHL